MKRTPAGDPNVVEFREPFGVVRTVVTGLILLGAAYLLVRWVMHLYQTSAGFLGWAVFGIAFLVVLSIGVMAVQHERLVIDRRSGVLQFWKAGTIPFVAQTHQLHALMGCVITRQEQSSDHGTYTLNVVRVVFKDTAAAVLETRSWPEAQAFARDVMCELGLNGEPEVVQQIDDQEELRQWVEGRDKKVK